jgi:hypothetical protein
MNIHQTSWASHPLLRSPSSQTQRRESRRVGQRRGRSQEYGIHRGRQRSWRVTLSSGLCHTGALMEGLRRVALAPSHPRGRRPQWQEREMIARASSKRMHAEWVSTYPFKYRPYARCGVAAAQSPEVRSTVHTDPRMTIGRAYYFVRSHVLFTLNKPRFGTVKNPRDVVHILLT